MSIPALYINSLSTGRAVRWGLQILTCICFIFYLQILSAEEMNSIRLCGVKTKQANKQNQPQSTTIKQNKNRKQKTKKKNHILFLDFFLILQKAYRG